MSEIPATEVLPPPPRRRSRLSWAAAAAAVALLAIGSVLAITGYLRKADPANTVRDYFEALERADAPAALGFGDLPAGRHQLLTSEVLRAQRASAPISHLSVLAVERIGARATVMVEYSLPFPDRSETISDNVAVTRRDGRWRLVAAAVPTELRLPAAQNRATVTGAAVPSGPVLLFPGALPISLDTPNLMLAENSRTVRFSAPGPQVINVVVSPTGETSINAAVNAAVTRCLTATTSDPSCPLPDDDRAVPGTLWGSVQGTDRSALSLQVMSNPDGRIEINGTLAVSGTYTRLDFDNMPQAKSGTAQLPLFGLCYATSPTTIVWGIS